MATLQQAMGHFLCAGNAECPSMGAPAISWLAEQTRRGGPSLGEQVDHVLGILEAPEAKARHVGQVLGLASAGSRRVQNLGIGQLQAGQGQQQGGAGECRRGNLGRAQQAGSADGGSALVLPKCARDIQAELALAVLCCAELS